MENILRFFHTIPALGLTRNPQPKQFLSVNLLFFIIFSLGLYSNSQADNLDNYNFSSDDQISITVFGEPDLSLKNVRIATNGSISVPLIGQVQVQGLTAAELETKLTQLFADGYLKKPDITVSIVEYRQFYINGEVKKPGGYSYRDGLTIERAVALAGGFSERASKDKITIAHEKNKDKVIRVELTTPIQPGDVITVEESFF